MGRGTKALMTNGYRWNPSFSGDSSSILVPGKGCGCFTPGFQFRCGVCTARTPGVAAGNLVAAPRAPFNNIFLGPGRKLACGAWGGCSCSTQPV